MSTGTFTPAPGAAPLPRQVLSRARMEARLMLRNGEQLLLAVVIPVIVLVGAVAGSERVGLELDAPAIDTFAPGVLALAVMSTAFTSLAIATGFERRYGVIKWLGSSPLPRAGLLAGKVLALLLVEALQVVVLGAVINERPSLVAMVTADLTDKISAHDLIGKIASLVDGGGGGKPDMAEAGGKDPSRLSEALEEAYRVVDELLT